MEETHEGKESQKVRRKQFEHYESDFNHSNHLSLWLLLLEGRKGGTMSNPFPKSISALFMLFLFTFIVTLIPWPATSPHGQGRASF